MTNLRELFFEHQSKVIDKWEQYLGIYESELSNIVSRDEPIRLLEVGIQNGGSLELWEKYLPADSLIFGVDIDPNCAKLEFLSPRISVHIFDAADGSAIPKSLKDQSFDIIIDDGSHVSSDIIATFNLMFPLLRNGGKYFIEDLECSYYKTHEGGLLHQHSSIEWLKHLVDTVNADHIRPDDVIPASLDDVIARFRNGVSRVTFYDSVAVVEKLTSAKERPFRRLLSGEACQIEPAFDLLTVQPRSVYEPMFYGAAAARKLDQTLIESYEASRLRLAEADIAHAELRRQWQQDVENAQTSAASAHLALSVKDEYIATLVSDNSDKDRLIRELHVQLRSSENDNAVKDLSIKELRAQLWAAQEASAAQTRQLEQTSFRLAAVLGLLNLVEAQGNPVPESWRFELHHQDGNAVTTSVRADDDYRFRAMRLNQQLLSRRADFYQALAHEFNAGLTLALKPFASVPIRYLVRLSRGRKLEDLLELQKRSLAFDMFDQEALSYFDESGIFDEDFYLKNNKDIRGVDVKPIRHFMQTGAVEGRDPHGQFGVEEYLTDHQDVSSERINPLIHFIQSGASEGRAIRPGIRLETAEGSGEILGGDLNRQTTAVCIIRSSGLFDAAFYRNQNPDITLSIDDAIRHYVSHGTVEGRDPCKTFSTSQYLSANPAIADAGMNPFVHYIVFGARENLDPKPNATHLDSSAGPSSEAEIVRSSDLFDSEYYRQHYEDVRISEIEPIEHFMLHGLWEDRKPNAMFDPLWYRSFYPDIALAGANPFLHYLQWGASEGRSPCLEFDGQWYLESNSEVAQSGELALKHYIRIGKGEGRLPKDPHAAYRQYVLRDRQINLAEADDVRHHIEIMRIQPRFMIFVEGTEGDLKDHSRSALSRQFYPHFEILDAERVEDLRASTALGVGSFLVWLKAGDVLHERALYEFASEINADPAVELIYADDDVMVNGKRSNPFFKPDWSPDYLESLDYVGASACFAMDRALQDLLSASSRYDFVLKFTERHEKVVHIRKVLNHLQCDRFVKVHDSILVSDQKALNDRVLRTGRRASVTSLFAEDACYDLQIDLRRQPLVSVIIPTAGKIVKLNGKPTDLLFHCLDTIVAVSTYKNIEFVVIDNGDLGPERADLLDRRGCVRITYNETEFNIAKKLNLGAEAARGELLLLLNDDVEPLTPNWIERLVEHFEKSHVGVVGSKLLYPDRTTQHVGVVLNAGVPDHVRRFRPSQDVGYFYSTKAVRNFVAVTGACMMTPASVYKQVGGYTEALSVNYNDTDYCLKVIEAGKSVVYAPQSELIHFESQSREARVASAEIDYFAERWAAYGVSDPYYNERNLTVASPTFEVANNPRLI